VTHILGCFISALVSLSLSYAPAFHLLSHSLNDADVVHHWNDTLFSFKTTRSQSFTFENGQFVMIGLEVDGKPLLRAYSIASANYEDELEFFSIKVPDGALTSRLQKVQPGDDVILTTKATGQVTKDLGMPEINIEDDRFMICGNNDMLRDLMNILDDKGFGKANSRSLGEYVIEMAFIEK
jgi:ferredoxin-NADP reductase